MLTITARPVDSVKFKLNYTILVFFINVISILAQEKPQDVTFVDITKHAGIDFRYTFGDTTYENILESSGSGVTVFDYDGDGDLDLYLLNGSYLKGISDPHGAAAFKRTDLKILAHTVVSRAVGLTVRQHRDQLLPQGRCPAEPVLGELILAHIPSAFLIVATMPLFAGMEVTCFVCVSLIRRTCAA